MRRPSCDQTYILWENGIELFTRLNEVMVETYKDPEGLLDSSGYDMEKWGSLRMSFIQITQKGDWRSNGSPPLHLQLSDRYFDNLYGHALVHPTPPELDQ